MRGAFASILFLALVATTAVAQSSDRVVIMTYNVENFFDDVDDPRYPNDRETLNNTAYVPAKAAAIARVINRFSNRAGPDVLVLTEIENEAALDALVSELLPSGAYQTKVFFDADPTRPAPKSDFSGIDVSMISKLPLATGSTPTSHVCGALDWSSMTLSNCSLNRTFRYCVPRSFV